MRFFETTVIGEGPDLKVRFRLIGVNGQLYEASLYATKAGVELEGRWPVFHPRQTIKLAEWVIVAAAVADELRVGRFEQFDEEFLRESNR